MEEAAGLLGIHPQTLRAWDVQGKIWVVRTPGGKRGVPESEVRRLQGETAEHPSTPGEAKGAIDVRVSAQDQKARGDLARQVAHLRERLAQQGISPVREVSDVASGLLDKGRGLLAPMNMARKARSPTSPSPAATA
jgi:putative resolvase